MSQEYTLTRGNIEKQLIGLGLPLFVGNIFQQLYSAINAIIVGTYVGEEAFAALGISSTIMNLFIFIIAGVCTGISILIAQLYGEGNEKKLRNQCYIAGLLGVIFTIVLSIAGIILLSTILSLISTPSNLLSDSKIYLTIIFCGMIFTFLYNFLSAILRAIGNTRMATVFLMISLCVNVALGYIFVAIANIGIVGVAYSTVISQALSVALCLIYIIKKTPYLVIRREDMFYNKSMAVKTAKFGFTSALQQSNLYLGKLLIQGAINTLGTTAIIAYTAVSCIEGILLAFGDSGANSISIFVAQNTGHHEILRAKSGLWRGMLLLVSLGIFLSLLVYLNTEELMLLFISKSSDKAIAYGLSYFHIVCFFYFLSFIGNSFVGYFRGTGRINIPLIGTTMQIIIRVILTYALILRFSLSAVAIATGIGWLAIITFQTTVYALEKQNEAKVREPK